MDARATRRGAPAAILWGALGVLAWATLTVVLGGGSAHADEQEDAPLDGLTSLVSDTVSAVTAPVAPVVTQVVAPVVTKVAAPVQQAAPAVVQTVTQAVAATPVVGPATAPVVHEATDAVDAIVTPVADALADSPVSRITDPILDGVADIPVVGDLVTDLGVVTAVGDVVGVVDDTTALLGSVTGETVPPVLEALDPTTPTPVPAPGTDAIAEPAAPSAHPPATLAVAPGSASVVSPTSTPARSIALFTTHESARTADDTTPVPAGPLSGGSPGSPGPASSAAGSGGGIGAANARLNDANPSPLRAGERTSGASDDALPSSPVADTDVSPD